MTSAQVSGVSAPPATAVGDSSSSKSSATGARLLGASGLEAPAPSRTPAVLASADGSAAGAGASKSAMDQVLDDMAAAEAAARRGRPASSTRWVVMSLVV